MANYLMNLTKDDGSSYEPDSLTSIHRAIDRYLGDMGYSQSLVTSEDFKLSKQVLASKRKELKREGKGNRPNRAEPLTDGEEKLLWESEELGDSNPKCLQNAIWFLNTKVLGFRGSDESRQLKWGDITLESDLHGKEYLKFTERSTKTRTGENSDVRAYQPCLYQNQENTEQCPVRLYKLYRARRSQNMLDSEAPFYLTVNHQGWNKTSGRWYKDEPMGKNYLAKMMKVICEKAGIKGKKTNHSVRKTCITNLLQAGVDPVLIQQLSGHKNLKSIKKTMQQQASINKRRWLTFSKRIESHLAV